MQLESLVLISLSEFKSLIRFVIHLQLSSSPANLSYPITDILSSILVFLKYPVRGRTRPCTGYNFSTTYLYLGALLKKPSTVQFGPCGPSTFDLTQKLYSTYHTNYIYNPICPTSSQAFQLKQLFPTSLFSFQLHLLLSN